MLYKKFSAPLIFDGYRFWENQVLLVQENGTIEALLPQEEAGDGVAFFNGILSPGFVNCHCHLELSHMRGKIPEGTGLVDFVFRVVSERGATETEILAAIAAAEEEMKKGGIVAVGDICNNTLTLPQKQKGRLHYYNFIEASGWLPAVSAARVERAKLIFDGFTKGAFTTTPNTKHKTQNSSLVPHAPYSVSEELWQALQPFFKDKIVSIHNQETSFEDALFLEGTGDFTRMYQQMQIDNSHHRPTRRSSVQSYFNKLKGAEKILLVHNTFTNEEDVQYINRETENITQHGSQLPTQNPKPQTFFCLCVNANQYIERAMPLVDMLRANGCRLVLGTDSLASNKSLSIVEEIKTIRRHFPHLPLAELLSWATSNGAEALGMDDRIGSFERGKKPGVLLLTKNAGAVKEVLISS